ncbi:MAG: hypothetical protein ACW967_05840 [Candidatus Hodarchaeales archaeon]|jgi:hypothetical protein
MSKMISSRNFKLMRMVVIFIILGFTSIFALSNTDYEDSLNTNVNGIFSLNEKKETTIFSPSLATAWDFEFK